MANDAGTSRAGVNRLAARELAATSAIEKTDVAITIVGSAVKSSDARNSASRVALPPMNCAVTAPAQIIAVTIEPDGKPERGVMPREDTLLLGVRGDPITGDVPTRIPVPRQRHPRCTYNRSRGP